MKQSDCEIFSEEISFYNEEIVGLEETSIKEYDEEEMDDANSDFDEAVASIGSYYHILDGFSKSYLTKKKEESASDFIERRRKMMHQLMDDYRSDNIFLRNDAIMHMQQILSRWIFQCIKNFYPMYYDISDTKRNNYENRAILFNAAIVEIVLPQYMEEYDPDVSLPTTYFTDKVIRPVLNRAKEALIEHTGSYHDEDGNIVKRANADGINAYYLKKKREKEIIEQKFVSKGYIPSFYDIADSSDLSVRTLTNLKFRELNHHVEVSADRLTEEAGESILGHSKQWQPGKEMLLDERNKVLYSALAVLDPLERQVFCLRRGAYDSIERPVHPNPAENRKIQMKINKELGIDSDQAGSIFCMQRTEMRNKGLSITQIAQICGLPDDREVIRIDKMAENKIMSVPAFRDYFKTYDREKRIVQKYGVELRFLDMSADDDGYDEFDEDVKEGCQLLSECPVVERNTLMHKPVRKIEYIYW